MSPLYTCCCAHNSSRKSADVLIINGNPAEDIKALHDANTIVKQGEIIKERNELLI